MIPPLPTTFLRIPAAKFSILFAVLLMASFVVINAFFFSEGTRRLELMDQINRASFPELVTEIEDMLWQTDADAEHASIGINKVRSIPTADFMVEHHALRDKLRLLQEKSMLFDGSSVLIPDYAALQASLDRVGVLYAPNASDTSPEQQEISYTMDKVDTLFHKVAQWGHQKNRNTIDATLGKLREREKHLRYSAGGFVMIGCMTVIFLIIDLYRREELLMQARQAERVKSIFFAMMSHEIRTPINGVLGTLTLLMETGLSTEQGAMAQTARDAAGTLLSIVNDVLDYSKIEAGKLEIEVTDYSLRDLAEQAIHLMRPLAREKGLTLSYHIEDGLPDALRGDPSRLRQVLINFLSNAVKFTESGSVELHMTRDFEAMDGSGAAMLRFNVTDTGIGISPEEQRLLFREFSQVEGSLTRRFSGTGLGLAICARLATMMKGSIGVVSDKGKGSIFWFKVPLVEAQGAVMPRPAEFVCSPAPNAAQILLVEDNVTNQTISAAYLRKAGHEVDIAENGAIAVERVKQKNYDLVFMDVSMPVMDGLEATRTIRALGGQYKQLPILAMTAHAMRSDREACLQAGMNGYIAKPAERETILEAVQRWAGTPYDPILSCNEALLNPGQNPDGSMILKASDLLPCIDDPMLISGPPLALNVQDGVIRQLYSDLGGEAFARYEKIFRADVAKLGQCMLEAADNKDWPGVKLHAHSLKSSVLNFGLTELSHLAENIETQCMDKGRADATLLAQWPGIYDAAMAALKGKLAGFIRPAA